MGIQVTGLPSSVRKTHLQAGFSDFGQIARIDLHGPKAFLEFDSKDDAKEAIKIMDGEKFEGATIRVEMKQSAPPPQPAARAAAEFRQAVVEPIVEHTPPPPLTRPTPPQTKKVAEKNSVLDRRKEVLVTVEAEVAIVISET